MMRNQSNTRRLQVSKYRRHSHFVNGDGIAFIVQRLVEKCL